MPSRYPYSYFGWDGLIKTTTFSLEIVEMHCNLTISYFFLSFFHRWFKIQTLIQIRFNPIITLPLRDWFLPKWTILIYLVNSYSSSLPVVTIMSVVAETLAETLLEQVVTANEFLCPTGELSYSTTPPTIEPCWCCISQFRLIGLCRGDFPVNMEMSSLSSMVVVFDLLRLLSFDVGRPLWFCQCRLKNFRTSNFTSSVVKQYRRLIRIPWEENGLTFFHYISNRVNKWMEKIQVRL